jgi:tRNA pseudouridine55 synthase
VSAGADEVHGILLLDKPLGLSSAAAVARAKRLFGARKAGHTGSLDPLASGMLPICFGEATKFGALMLDADKAYRLTVRLGERTASADLESPVIERRELAPLSREDLERLLEEFPREYPQVPPMHSAIKQDGKPLYEYARAGEVRERAARLILIREMGLIEWRRPDVTFDVRCTKGAYMRVLAEDLAARLGTVGHLVELVRLCVAPFAEERQWTFEALEALAGEARRGVLLPVDAALTHCRRLDLPDHEVEAVRQGRSVSVAADCTGNVRIYAPGLGFLGLGAVGPVGRLKPLRLISAATNRPDGANRA